MKRLVISAVFVSLFLAANAQTRSADDSLKDLDKASAEAVATFKKGGSNGLIAAVDQCWRAKPKPYCAYLDFSAKRIDDFAHGALGTPKTEYFDIQEVVIRARSLVAATSISPTDQAAYVNTVQRAAYMTVDSQLWQVAR